MAEQKTVTYDLKQVTRWVLVQKVNGVLDGPQGRMCTSGVGDVAEFRRRDEAVRVMNMLRHADPDCTEPQEPAPQIAAED